MAYKTNRKPPQRVDDDYKAKYEALYAACGKANGQRKKLVTTIARDVGALLKIMCDPDPPGCAGPIQPPTTDKLMDMLLKVQQANAAKKQKLEDINTELNDLFLKICDPDPPGCNGNL